MQNFESIYNWFTKLKRPIIISGPCSAETEKQVIETAQRLKKTGKVSIFRAGIWKPRTRPNAFEGIGEIGLEWLKNVKIETGLPITVEVANASHVEKALEYGVDILWIGARTTVNPFSVQEIADSIKGTNTKILIKNPINPDIDLWIGAIERIQNAGITQIGAIARGFSKYGESKYRNTPLWHIPIELKRRLPNIPIICDPSHICGNRTLLHEVSQKALDLDFDGLMIESHITPDEAWSDAQQQITPEKLAEMLETLIIRNNPSKIDKHLAQYREQIDNIDELLLDMIEQRMQVSKNIGAYKKSNKITILQTNRWNEIIKQTLEKGKEKGLSEVFIMRYLNALHEESINQQNIIMNK